MRELLLAMLLAQAGDLTTTAIGMSKGCREGNPSLRQASIGRIATVKTAAVTAEVTIAWGAHKKQHDGGAKAVLLAGVGMGAFATIWNTRQILRCRG